MVFYCVGKGLKVGRIKNILKMEALKNSGKDINVLTKTTVLGVFDFRAFLNLTMLLSESERARASRQMMQDLVIDLINRKTGGGTKYINQRDFSNRTYFYRKREKRKVTSAERMENKMVSGIF